MTSRRLLLGAVACVCLVTGPLLWGDGVDVPDDAAYYGLASWEWLTRAVADGVNPWWVPGKLGGVSLFSDVVPQGPFYPGCWLALVMPVIPALGLAALLHAIGTLFAVRWLARLHGVRDELAILAGAGVAAGPLAVWAAIDFQVDAWPTFLWFPVALGCLHQAASARDASDTGRWLRWVGLGAAAVGLMLLGTHLRIAIGAGAALALWSLLRGRDLRGAVLVGLLGLLAGAPSIVPMLMEARHQGVGGASGMFGPPDLVLGFWNIAGWLTPKATLHARDLGLGAVLGVGVLGAVVMSREHRRLIWFVAVLTVAGSTLPGVQYLLAPLTALVQPVTLIYPALALIPAAVLGAIGIERLLTTRRGAERTRVTQLVGAIAVLGLLRLALGRWTFPSGMAQGMYALAVAQLAVIALLARQVLKRTDPVPLLVALALLDLASFGLRAHLAVPSAPLRSTADVHGDPALLEDGFLDVEDLATGFDAALLGTDDPHAATEEDVVDFSAQAPGVQRRVVERTWPLHAAMAVGSRGLAGRSKMPPSRASALLAPVAEELSDLGEDTDVLTHLFGARGMGRRLLEVTGTARALRSEQVVVEIGPQERSPHCYAITEATVMADQDERIARLLQTPWWQRPRLLEAPTDATLSPATVACGDPLVDPRIAVVGGPALVAVDLPLHPGWRVSSGSTELTPIPVDQVHQAVLVTDESTTLRWKFVPPGLQAAGAAAALGWLLIVGLWVGGRRMLPVVALMALLLPSSALADSIPGVVRGARLDGPAEAWLATSLDLTRGDQPVARSPVEDGRFELQVPESADGDAWIFLRQEVPVSGAPPIVFHRPLSLVPFDIAAPPDKVSISAVPPDTARRRATGQSAAGWWRTPLLLALLVFLGAPLLRRRLLGQIRGAELRPDQAAPRADLPEAPPEEGMERRAGWLIVGLAFLLRLPGANAPLDLLEWTYGPGTARVTPADLERSFADVLEGLLHPACLELVHPPLWHSLMQLLDTIGGGREWLLRAPSLLLSVATVWMLWRLTRRFSPQAGLLAAGGYAIAAPAIDFGQDATPYAFLSFVVVGSLLLLLRALRTGTPAAYAAWLGLLVVGFLAHYATALFGGAQLLVLLYLWGRQRSEPRWVGAAAQALRVGPLVGAPAVGWSFLHFANFSPVALDTRLYADTYPADPGLGVFLKDFGSVGLGIAPVGALLAVPLIVLILVGLVAATRRDRHMGLLLAAIVGAFAGGTLFFYVNLIESLDGRIFWGFRWVSWFLPVAMILGAVGLASTRGVARLSAAVLGLGWLVGTVGSSLAPELRSTHPDYRAAAGSIAADLQDRDGLVALPMWGQRGPVRTYLSRLREGQLTEIHDTTAWDFDGRAVYLEAADEGLPFESGVLNAHLDRVWVVVADERMFGRAKFSGDIARRAVAWADRHMKRVRSEHFDHLELVLYARPELPLPAILDPADLRARPHLEPNTPLCRDADDEHWRLHVRLDQTPGSVEVTAGSVLPSADSTGWSAVVEGGQCAGPAPVIRFGSGVTPGTDEHFP